MEGDPHPARADPRSCLRAWNSDPAAIVYGRHNFNSYRYEGALVTFLDLAANELAAGEDGHCAVVFPSRALDPEPFAAGQVLIGSRWQPISLLEGVSTVRVAELQARAAGSSINASWQRAVDSPAWTSDRGWIRRRIGSERPRPRLQWSVR